MAIYSDIYSDTIVYNVYMHMYSDHIIDILIC